MQEGSTAVALAMVTPGYDQDPASGVADYTTHQDQAQFEADKRSVYKHPLFPLLALLFERCELATQSSDNSMSESFNMDIQAFVQHQERDRKPFLINDPEIDGLMIKAIQVLRIHLLELEKVQELCKDFCNRYIGCLKGKMQSENLLRSDYGHHGHDIGPSSGSNGSSPLQVLSSTGNDVEPGANGLGVSGADALSENGSADLPILRDEDHYHNPHHHHQDPLEDPLDLGRSPRSSSNPHRRGHRSESQELDDPLSPSAIHGATPLSQIGATSCAPVNDIYLGQEIEFVSTDRLYLEEVGYWGLLAMQERESDYVDVGDASDEKYPDITVAGSPSPVPSDDDDDGCGSGAASQGHGGPRKGRQKRGVLPKQATSIMRAWLFHHLVHPYPTEDEKRQIARETNLTLLQVNNWFINARRRILQPMLDGAGADALPRPGKRPKASKTQNSGENSREQNISMVEMSGQTSATSGQQQTGSHQPGGTGSSVDWQSDDSMSDSGSDDFEILEKSPKNRGTENYEEDEEPEDPLQLPISETGSTENLH